jgi:hypothetical protein
MRLSRFTGASESVGGATTWSLLFNSRDKCSEGRA